MQSRHIIRAKGTAAWRTVCELTAADGIGQFGDVVNNCLHDLGRFDDLLKNTLEAWVTKSEFYANDRPRKFRGIMCFSLIFDDIVCIPVRNRKTYFIVWVYLLR